MGETVIHGGDVYRNKIQYDFSVNVNPLGMPEEVRQAIRASADLCERYPDIYCERLRRKIGEFYGVSPEHILCGNGASELLMAIVHGVRPERTIIPVPSFYGYEWAAASSGGEPVYFSMLYEEGFGLSEEDAFSRLIEVLEDVPDGGESLLILANPNNPTGQCLPPELTEKLLRRCLEKRIVVVLDECFLEFTENGRERSCLNRTAEFPNLIVLQAFTKIYAIPGIRLGYMVCGNDALTEKISRQLPEWNVSLPAQMAGIAALKSSGYPEETVSFVKREREYLADKLLRLGIRVYPSEANFLLIYTELPIYSLLLERGILIRDCENFRGLGKGFYRIAVKSRAENETLIKNLSEILQMQKF